MKFYRIIESDDDKTPVHFKNGELPFDENCLEDGIDLSEKFIEHKVVKIDEDVDLMDWASVVLPVISQKFLDILLSFNSKGLQYIPIDLVDKNLIMHQYYILNYVPVLFDALDLENSKIIKSTNPKVLPNGLAIAAIIPEKTMDLDIFKLSSNVEIIGLDHRIYVSERLMRKLKKEKITGIEFCPTILSSKGT